MATTTTTLGTVEEAMRAFPTFGCPCGGEHPVPADDETFSEVTSWLAGLSVPVDTVVSDLGRWEVPSIWVKLHGLSVVDAAFNANKRGWKVLG